MRDLFIQNLEFLFTYKLGYDNAEFTRTNLSKELRYNTGHISDVCRGKATLKKSKERNEYVEIAEYFIKKFSHDNRDKDKLLEFSGIHEEALTAELLAEIMAKKMFSETKRMEKLETELAETNKHLSEEKNIVSKCEAKIDKLETELAETNKHLSERSESLAESNKNCERLTEELSGFKSYKRQFTASTAAAALFLCVAVFFAILPAREPSPDVELIITRYTPLGETEENSGQAIVAGYIKVKNGSPIDYMATMALRTEGVVYAPKPSFANPKVIITEGESPDIGYFICVFAEYGSNDIFAEELYVYIVDGNFNPDENIELTKYASVVHEMITR
jgi:uncharacterized coiled-coil protein SlyX